MKITKKDLENIINETIKELFKEENPGLPVPDGARLVATPRVDPGLTATPVTGKEVLRDLDTVWRAAILNGFNPQHPRSPMSAEMGRTIQDLYGLMMMDELGTIPLVQNIVQDMIKILKQRGVTDISKYGGPVGDLLDSGEWGGYPPLESPYRTIKATDFDP
jgi:hypothetical protein